MGCEVYANNMTIACKAAEGKSIAAMPDVCFTPPLTPATPPGVPIPYPNTAMASDTTDGSKTVLISGQEVMLKEKSSFKQSTGDEAGSAPKKGVVTSQIKGKVNFCAWSMDVKFEGENIPRHLDLTLHNEASVPANTPTWPYMDQMAWSLDHACIDDAKKEHQACKECKPHGEGDPCSNKGCQDARKCMLVPYRHDSKNTCCEGQSGHHLIEDHGFCKPRGKPTGIFAGSAYQINDAPCVCAHSPNSNWESEHGDLHSVQGVKENYAIMTAAQRQPPRSPKSAWTFSEARQAAVDAHAATFPGQCKEQCIAAQLNAYYKSDRVGAGEDTPLRTKKYGFGKDPDQMANGVTKIKALAEKRIGSMASGPWT